ncbi:MAG: putative Lipoprotein-releasing system ATP-binding protein LolD [Candidatus Saccharibacteria bacterium]|nr:putative Lipoprotein-releasing system ATP-binding protein LolD [Candidatus Saccharibacteria bacterium]
MIEVKAITKTYGKSKNAFKALDNVSFTIPTGTSVGILGRSGSGKSTLMHAVSGLDKPESGEVIIDGQNILELNQKAVDQFRARTIGFIFQSFFVQPNETVEYNVSLPLEIAEVPTARRTQKIDAALEAVDLSDKKNSKARNLSGGQKQRLAIARAIVNEPSIIFADEPTGNLDSTTGQKIEDLLFDYNRRKGVTLIIVTHDEELARRCDMIINVKDGKIESVKEPAELKV